MIKSTPLLLAGLLQAGLLLSAARVPAQAPPPPPPPLASMHRGMRPPLPGNTSVPLGQIIGNKRTHVFHVAGDHSALPAPQNRVIFHSTAEARAAGYHAAGQGKPGAMPKMHGSRRTGAASATGRPQPPRPLPGTALPPPPPAPLSPR